MPAWQMSVGKSKFYGSFNFALCLHVAFRIDHDIQMVYFVSNVKELSIKLQ